MKHTYIYKSIPTLLFCSATALCATGVTVSQPNTSTQSLSGRNTCPVLPNPLLRWAQPGDIIYESSSLVNPNIIFGHICIVTGVDNGKVKIMEAVPPCVQEVIMDSWRFSQWHDVLLRPNIDDSERPDVISSAISFIKKQILKPYSLFGWTHDPSSDRPVWNCAELAWAGYFNAGLTICSKALLVDRGYANFSDTIREAEKWGLLSPHMTVDCSTLSVVTDWRHFNE